MFRTIEMCLKKKKKRKNRKENKTKDTWGHIAINHEYILLLNYYETYMLRKGESVTHTTL